MRGRPILTATIRDFSSSHPDFEALVIDDDRGIARESLGPADTPVYAGGLTTPTTHGRRAFDEWFRDVPGDPLHLFYAERHTVGSTFRVETSIAEFDQCN